MLAHCDVTFIHNNVVFTCCIVMANANDVMPINIRSNTVRDQCNEEML